MRNHTVEIEIDLFPLWQTSQAEGNGFGKREGLQQPEKPIVVSSTRVGCQVKSGPRAERVASYIKN